MPIRGLPCLVEQRFLYRRRCGAGQHHLRRSRTSGISDYSNRPTAFQANTGTIIQGGFSPVGNNIVVRNLSVDVGSAGGHCTTGADGLSINGAWPGGSFPDTALVENVSTLLCSANGVHSIIGVANHLTYVNVTTRGGLYGPVAFGTDVTMRGVHASYESGNGFIIKSTNFSPAINTSQVNLSDFWIDNSQRPNIDSLGGATAQVNVRGMNITNGQGLLISARVCGS